MQRDGDPHASRPAGAAAQAGRRLRGGGRLQGVRDLRGRNGAVVHRVGRDASLERRTVRRSARGAHLVHREHPELEALLVASPDDLGLYEAYGRWLAENGDPRAELILFDCASERQGRKPNRDERHAILERQNRELYALAPFLSSCMHGWPFVWARGFLRELTLQIHEGDATSREQVEAVLVHPYTRLLRRLSLGITSGGAAPWLVERVAERRPQTLESLFVSGASSVSIDPLRSIFARPGRLGTYNGTSHFGAGPFHGIRMLDVRDQQVDWRPSDVDASWPDLEILVLRPRGSHADSLRWSAQMLSSARAMPKLREVWACESKGDELLEVILASPLLPQLRRLDFTDTLTNRGAALLYSNAERLSGIEEIRIGSTGDRRASIVRVARVGAPNYEPPPLGELEIDGPWRSRLARRFGKQIRFKIPVGHPHLGL
ncbi:hypothetical protein [Polyangium sp. 15x6]|uniref:hypothetical protein n=1 Tax=Polyangium sp. 15x6 TaxID=3042687 RepID=UPI002499E1E1|nr:hypothetical protein [Polyangium sp. 15x6]MDI3286653.1 hypothetical protein [Polyangium sp. 15x6]